MESTIVKGVKVLEILVRSPGPARLSAIARELDLPKSGVHRLLVTLSELGFVRQDPASGHYAATLKLWEWGQQVIAVHPAKRAAAPFLQELHKLTGETVNLLIRDDIEVLYIDKILAERPLRFSTQPGTRALAAVTGAGKAMLAHESVDMVMDLVERTIATGDPRARDLDPNALLEELQRIRAEGYAKSDGSWTQGIMSFAAPILGFDGRAAATLSVTAPRERITPEKEANIIESLRYICARIAEMVGRL